MALGLPSFLHAPYHSYFKHLEGQTALVGYFVSTALANSRNKAFNKWPLSTLVCHKLCESITYILSFNCQIIQCHSTIYPHFPCPHFKDEAFRELSD